MKSLNKKQLIKYMLFIIMNCFFFLIPLSYNSYTSDTKMEYIANEMANIATKLGDNNLFAVTIPSSEESAETTSSNNLGVSVTAQNNLMYTVNPFQLSNGFLNNALSFSFNGIDYPYINYVLSSGAYSNHYDKGKIILDTYYLELYKKDSNSNYNGTSNFCYISQKYADQILKDNPNYQSYDDIIDQRLNIAYNNETFEWKISNVILNHGQYYNGLVDIYDDFVLAYKWVPKPFCNNVTLSAYFGGNTYANIRAMKFLSNIDKSSFKVYRKNLSQFDSKTLDTIENYLNTLPTYKNNTKMYYLEIAIIGICLITATFFFTKAMKKELNLIKLMVSSTISLVIIYSIFWLLYKISKNVTYLSNIGVLGLIVLYAISLLTLLVIAIINNIKEKYETH